MPKKQREISVSPGHDTLQVGSCSACTITSDKHGNVKQQEVWLLRFGIASYRLCDDCIDELEKQIHQQKARRKATKK